MYTLRAFKENIKAMKDSGHEGKFIRVNPALKMPLSARGVTKESSSSQPTHFHFQNLPENLNDSLQESVGSSEQVMAEKPKTTVKKEFKHRSNKMNLSCFAAERNPERQQQMRVSFME